NHLGGAVDDFPHAPQAGRDRDDQYLDVDVTQEQKNDPGNNRDGSEENSHADSLDAHATNGGSAFGEVSVDAFLRFFRAESVDAKKTERLSGWFTPQDFCPGLVLHLVAVDSRNHALNNLFRETVSRVGAGEGNRTLV